MLYRVEAGVYLKAGVLDAPGQVVADSLQRLGFDEVRAVRMGKAIRLELEAPDENTVRLRVQAMGEKLLCNPVVETFEIEAVSAAVSPT